MALTLKLLLSQTTQEVDQHRLHPFVRWSANNRHPRRSDRWSFWTSSHDSQKLAFHLDEGGFFAAFPGRHYVVRLFFVGTSLKLINLRLHLWTESGVTLELRLFGLFGLLGLLNLTPCPEMLVRWSSASTRTILRQ